MTSKLFQLRHFTSDEIITYPLRQRLFCIGSADDNDCILSDPKAPAVAVKLESVQDGYRCTALVKKVLCHNGKKSVAVNLESGDLFAVCNEHFTLEEVPRQSTSDGHDSAMLENLSRFVVKIGREHRLHPLLHHLMNILLELTRGTDIFLFKLDENGQPQVFKSNGKNDGNELFSDTIIQEAIRRKTGICIANALADPLYKNAQSIADLKLQSVLCTPMLVAGRCVGLIYIGSHNPTVSFTREDLDIVTLYASIASMLINHIDYIAEQQATINRLTGPMSEEGEGIIASSPPMREVLSAVQAIAAADITVLLQGETGTGKNRIAELVHSHSRRSSRPFVIVNCSSLRGELLESELFGHRKGSFTGALHDHEGLFAAAQGGTLLLDEIGELELPLQAKLLRTLETGMVRPIGSTREYPVNVRMLCATNRNLDDMVQKNQFRADLYYRINQFPITVPPLRERGDDVELLAYLFLNRYKAEYPDKDIHAFHPDSLHYIRTHTWPGNIRELSNIIHRGVLMSEGQFVRVVQPGSKERIATDFEAATQQFQKQFMLSAISAADGNKELAAKNIGLSRSTFYRYCMQFGC